MKIHELKIQPEFFAAVCEGKKTFEIRFNDREYKAGEVLHLREWYGNEYTGRELVARVKYLLEGGVGLAHNYVIMSIKVI